MKLLKVGDGKYINPEGVTFIQAKRPDKIIIQFQSEVSCGSIGIPSSYLELRGSEAENFLLWLEANSERIII